jgi:hypothetical protein
MAICLSVYKSHPMTSYVFDLADLDRDGLLDALGEDGLAKVKV